MKITRGSLIVVLLVIQGFTFPDVTTSPVIVELFTAEGCSSCPPADELLQEMSGILTNEGKPVIGLSFHVTYWNKMGWEDPYSQENFTERQKRYNTVLKTGQLYTPQAVVNGVAEFVGSNPIAFRNLVTQAGEKKSLYTITATKTMKGNEWFVEYDLGRKPKQLVLNIAVVETIVTHFISTGENKNKTLTHTNVVRSFESITPQQHGELTIPLPLNADPDNLKVIVYTQNIRTLEINGVTQIDI